MFVLCLPIPSPLLPLLPLPSPLHACLSREVLREHNEVFRERGLQETFRNLGRGPSALGSHGNIIASIENCLGSFKEPSEAPDHPRIVDIPEDDDVEVGSIFFSRIW